MSSIFGGYGGDCSSQDTKAAVEMAQMDRCWCCGDSLYLCDAKMVRARQAEGQWVLKSVCCPCHQRTMMLQDVIVEVEGDHWTLRPMVVTPGM